MKQKSIRLLSTAILACGAPSARATATLSTIYDFVDTGSQNPPVTGFLPSGNLAIDAAGNVCGTTPTVGTYTQHHHHIGTIPAVAPYVLLPSVVVDPAGNLYGVTPSGDTSGSGMLHELSGPNHSIFTTLVNFNSSTGTIPSGQLTIDSKVIFSAQLMMEARLMTVPFFC